MPIPRIPRGAVRFRLGRLEKCCGFPTVCSRRVGQPRCPRHLRNFCSAGISSAAINHCLRLKKWGDRKPRRLLYYHHFAAQAGLNSRCRWYPGVNASGKKVAVAWTRRPAVGRRTGRGALPGAVASRGSGGSLYLPFASRVARASAGRLLKGPCLMRFVPAVIAKELLWPGQSPKCNSPVG